LDEKSLRWIAISYGRCNWKYFRGVQTERFAKYSQKDSSVASEYRNRVIKARKKARARGQARREDMKKPT